MSSINQFSNFFSFIQNGYLIKKNKISIPFSQKILNLLDLLTYEGFLKGYQILENKKKINIFLKYYQKQPSLKKIIQVSKPSKRVYIKNKFLKKNSSEFLILSTNQGFLSYNDAKKKNIGGELVCKIL